MTPRKLPSHIWYEEHDPQEEFYGDAFDDPYEEWMDPRIPDSALGVPLPSLASAAVKSGKLLEFLSDMKAWLDPEDQEDEDEDESADGEYEEVTPIQNSLLSHAIVDR